MMKKIYSIIAMSIVILLGFTSYRTTLAFFSDNSASTNNTFAAAEVFPSTTPSVTLTPTMTVTPTATPTLTFTITPTPTISQIATHLVISEIQLTGGTGVTGNDFIELYNPTNSTISLNGYRLVKRNASSPNDTSIIAFSSTASVSAHGFFLWASTDNSFATSIGADASTAANIDGNDSIALRLGSIDTGVIIDQVAWNPSSKAFVEGTETGTTPVANQSLERKALSTSTPSSMAGGGDDLKGNGFDSNDNATDFILRTTSQPQNSISGTEMP